MFTPFISIKTYLSMVLCNKEEKKKIQVSDFVAFRTCPTLQGSFQRFSLQGKANL